MWEIWVRFLDQEDTLEKEITIHSIILAWKFSWTEEPSGLHTVHGAAKSRTRLSDYHLQHFARMARTQQSHNIPVLVSGARSPQDSSSAALSHNFQPPQPLYHPISFSQVQGECWPRLPCPYFMLLVQKLPPGNKVDNNPRTHHPIYFLSKITAREYLISTV